MSADIPTTEPATLRAGDTWAWTRSLQDYPATTWTLKYSLVKSGVQKQITATASGTDHAVSVAKATTAAYAAGTWSWVASVTDGTSRYTVDQGTLTVLTDIEAASSGYDDRSHAQTMLDAIEAWLESKDPGVAEYEIAGRRMKYHSVDALIKLRSQYRAEVRREQAAERIANGLGDPRRIFVRFAGRA